MPDLLGPDKFPIESPDMEAGSKPFNSANKRASSGSVFAIKSEIARSANGNPCRVRGVKCLRQLFAEDYADRRVFTCATTIEVSANPSFCQVLLSVRSGLPDLSRSEMGAVRVRITDALDDGEIAAVIEIFERSKDLDSADQTIKR